MADEHYPAAELYSHTVRGALLSEHFVCAKDFSSGPARGDKSYLAGIFPFADICGSAFTVAGMVQQFCGGCCFQRPGTCKLVRVDGLVYARRDSTSVSAVHGAVGICDFAADICTNPHSPMVEVDTAASRRFIKALRLAGFISGRLWLSEENRGRDYCHWA